MLRPYIIFSFFLLPLSIGFVSASTQPPQITGKYAGDFQTCYNANLGGSARSITDFVCLDRAGNWQEMLSQIVLDREFADIDEEMMEYIQQLEESKGQYFGPDAKETFLTAVDAIEKNFSEYGYYWDKYKTLCETGILAEVADASGGVVNIEAVKYISGDDGSSCLNLVRTKLAITKEVSYNVLKLNKTQVRKDERKKYVQEERTKYDALLDLMRDIIGYLERILNGWPTKTTNPK